MTGIAEVWRAHGKTLVGPTHVGNDLVTVEVLTFAMDELAYTERVYAGKPVDEGARELLEKLRERVAAATVEPFASIPMSELRAIYWREAPDEIRRALAPRLDETDPFDGEPDAGFAAYEGDDEE